MASLAEVQADLFEGGNGPRFPVYEVAVEYMFKGENYTALEIIGFRDDRCRHARGLLVAGSVLLFCLNIEDWPQLTLCNPSLSLERAYEHLVTLNGLADVPNPYSPLPEPHNPSLLPPGLVPFCQTPAAVRHPWEPISPSSF